MARQTVRRSTVIAALTGGVVGMMLSVIPASASTASGFTFGPIGLPSSGQGVRVSGNCPLYLSEDLATITFLSGNEVQYGPPSGFSGGFNVEGTATVTFAGAISGDTFTGHTHLWANQNYNPAGNLQQYNGVTLSFNGTSGTTESLSITASLGETTAATGHVSGWGHVNITCGGFASA